MTATTVAESQRQPRPQRALPTPQRAPLQVVPEGYRSPQARRRRARLMTASGVLVACVIVFGLAGIHVLLAEGQFRLGSLQTKATDAQTQYVRLRLQVAQLESPQRIVADAQERLGMVSPSALTYLTPTSPATVVAHPTTATRTATTTKRAAATTKTTHQSADPTQGWATAKPALASHP
jgi:hypothetical protein